MLNFRYDDREEAFDNVCIWFFKNIYSVDQYKLILNEIYYIEILYILYRHVPKYD